MAMQRGEDIDGWLSRVLVPLLRRGYCDFQPLLSVRRRLHLKAVDSGGRIMRLVTVYGMGEVYFVASQRKLWLDPPRRRLVMPLHDKLILAARELGVAASKPIATHRRSAR
ncbi:hypothetical protein CCR95_22545 [Thiocystis minor]|nr:hypothetical protein [Thiocystis minor]